MFTLELEEDCTNFVVYINVAMGSWQGTIWLRLGSFFAKEKETKHEAMQPEGVNLVYTKYDPSLIEISLFY